MKIKNIYKVFFFISGALFMLGNATGPGSVSNVQVTGAPGSYQQNTGQPGTCANASCHGNSGNFDPSISIKLMDGGDEVMAYQPDKSYQLKISITPGSGNPSRYGFQAVSLDANNDQAGEWGNLGSGKHKVDLSGRSYVEHSSPSTMGSFEMEWIAPVSGTGNVTIYAASNAVNGNGGTTGDGVASGSLVLEENPVNSVLRADQEIARLKVIPNPVYETLNLQINSRIAGDFNIKILDILGNVATVKSISVQNGEQLTGIHVGGLSPGLYIVQLCGNGHLAAVQMLKN